MGSRKIVCESCGAVLPFEKVKDLDRCPVCDASFNEGDSGEKIEKNDMLEEANRSMIHVNQVHYPDGQMEGFIRIQCKKCLDILYISLDDAEIIKEAYVKLKDNIEIKCEKCGYKHINHYLTYCETISTAPPLPRCPVCNSAMLKKIKTSSKFLAAAAIGAFALPYNSKTFECKDCGYRF